MSKAPRLFFCGGHQAIWELQTEAESNRLPDRLRLEISNNNENLILRLYDAYRHQLIAEQIITPFDLFNVLPNIKTELTDIKRMILNLETKK